MRLLRSLIRSPLWALALLMLGSGCASIQTHRHLPGEFDLGPIASKHPSILKETRLKVAGPFFEHTRTAQNDQFSALRPLYTRSVSSDNSKKLQEWIWPMATSRQKANTSTWRFLTAMGTNWDVNDPASRYRLWVLPFWFQGRDAQGENYAALFPLYGKINEFLGRDKIHFALFPLYGHSTMKDLKTRSILWPIYSKTVGDGVYRHRVFPFYGVSKKEDRWKRSFCMWPIWNSVKFQTKEGEGSGFCLFPLYGRSSYKEQKIHWFIPPLIRITQGGENKRSHVLWPFFQSSAGEVDKLYFWPFFGSKTIGHVKNTFIAWPIYSRRHLNRNDEDVYRTYVLPIYHGHTHIPKDEAKGTTEKKVYKKLWPLFSYQKEKGLSRFRCFEFWPMKNTGPIERNWAPFWTLYTHQRTEEALESEFLWGMVRRSLREDGSAYTSIFPLIDWSTQVDEDGEVKKSWSLLKGLLGFDRQNDQNAFRLLYFLKFGGTKTEL